jgi:hypothetical protein
MNKILTPQQISLQRVIRFARRNNGILRGSLFVLGYAVWLRMFELVVLTFLTYFLGASASRAPRFDEISDAFSATELTLLGLAASIFVFALRAFNPLASSNKDPLITPQRLEWRFLPGFWHGAVLASGMILAFLFSGLYQYIGFFMQVEEYFISGVSIVLRTVSLVALVYCEEYLFRHKLSRFLQGRGATAGAGGSSVVSPPAMSKITIALFAGTLFCLIKRFQFDLGVMQTLTLFLISLCLSIRSFIDSDFGRGAGFLSALLIIFHPLLSLPILGSEFSGLVLVKPLQDMEGLTRLFTGGAGGPLASLALQLLLVLDILRGIFRYRETQ